MLDARRGSLGRAPRGPSLAGFPELATYVARTPGRPSMRVDPPPATRAMQAPAPARILRSVVLAILFGASAGGALACGLWYLLPYDSLAAATSAQRFALWEGVMWGLGLAGTLFGVAALLNATDLSSSRPLAQVRQQAADVRRGRTLYAGLPALPWMLLSCGAVLLLFAVLVRSALQG